MLLKLKLLFFLLALPDLLAKIKTIIQYGKYWSSYCLSVKFNGLKFQDLEVVKGFLHLRSPEWHSLYNVTYTYICIYIHIYPHTYCTVSTHICAEYMCSLALTGTLLCLVAVQCKRLWLIKLQNPAIPWVEM